MTDVWLGTPSIWHGFCRLACLAALAVGLAGCMPAPHYQDPLAEIAPSSAAGATSAKRAANFRDLSLGIVLTPNTRKAIQAASAAESLTGALFNGPAARDVDPGMLTNAVGVALRRRFRSVVTLANFAAAGTAGVDSVMALDIQIRLGSSSGTQTTVALRGIFLDGRRAPIGQVAGNGSATIPYPAFSFGFHKASTLAVKRFKQSLDNATALAVRLRAPAPSAPVLASASAGPPLRPLPANARRVALVVGNAHYRDVPALSNTANDARLVAQTLKNLGFTLVGGGAQLDLDRHQFLTEIAQFGRMLNGGSVAVFYYAGHGLQLRGENYLVPVDANPERPADADIQLVDTSAILHQMEDSGARLKVVMLDACRNNPFGGRGLRGVDSGLAQMAAPVGTLISYATAPGHVAEDGAAGGDGPYALALTRAMRQPGVGILRMFNNVAVRVDATTAHAQQPWLALSPIDGDFYFDGR